MRNTAVVCTVIASVSMLGFGAMLIAGPLNPPAGSVAPTYKTLSEVEPRIAVNLANTPGDADSVFKITQPGSYYLTGNVTGVGGKHGIEIVASGVSLDLMGFDVAGVSGSLSGVAVTVINLDNIAVVNGSVRNWGATGVELDTTRQCWVEGVRAYGNGSAGIDAGGSGATITNCSAGSNQVGMSTGLGATVTGCSANGNTSTGIAASQACVISNCSAYSNDANGISAGTGSIITDCAARFNTLSGISAGGSSLVRGNVCTGNDAAGIVVGSGDTRIEGNVCTGNAGAGIDVNAAGCFIVRNTCSGNTPNWAIVANNVVGPILDRTAPGSASISGNSAPDSTGSTHPNANFSH